MIPHLLESASRRLEAFAAAPRALLALDFDGTIALIAPTPESARIHAGAAAALEHLRTTAREGTAVAIVSGRPLATLRSLVPAVDYLIGLHGLELEACGRPPRLLFDPARADAGLQRVRARLEPIVAAGGRVEEKGHALAIHVRGLDSAAAAEVCDRFVAEVEAERAAGAPLEWIAGKAVVEVRPLGARKHLGLTEVLRELGGASLAFVGDDMTDEEVFAAYPQALTAVVMHPPRDTRAQTYLRSPAEVAALIRRVAELRGRRAAD